MDPKALSHLDPRQQEAYHRVMGTAAEIHGAGDPAATPSSTSPDMAPTYPTASFQPTIAPEPQAPEAPVLSEPMQSAPADAQPSWNAPEITTPSGAPDPSPSIFTNSAETPDPTQSQAPEPQAPVLRPESSFFTNPTPAPVEQSQPEQFPSDQLNPQDYATPDALSVSSPEALNADTGALISDNLTPVNPDPAQTSAFTQPAEPVMAQPFAQPLPSPSEVNQAAVAQREAPALLRVLYIVGAVIFFAVYTIFWIKIFKLPFLF